MQNYIIQIKQILEKTGWSQAQFAKELNVTFATVNRWINGHTNPHPAQLQRIKQLFKSTVGILPLSEHEIAKIIKTVMLKKKRVRNIKKILQDSEISQDFLLELTYNSDAIEGNALTKRETEAIIFDKATIKDRSLIEHLEAINHATVLRDIFEGNYPYEITEELIKEIHKALMQGIRTDAGQYAKHQRVIRGVNLILPHPSDIPEEMRLFCNKVNSYKNNPIEHIAKMHVEFEMIHPFGDGNGRVGRLLMIIQLIHQDFAPCVINVNEKANYYEFLEFAQKKSETHFVHFTAESIIKGYDIIEKHLQTT